MDINFDITSFLIGCVAGLLLSSLLRLRSLKELKLKLNAIGVDLGIKGFDEPKSSSGNNQTIGAVNGSANEINQAGRDINKTSNMYKMVQAAAKEAIAKSAAASGSGFLIKTRFSHYTKNRLLQQRLVEIQSGGDGWFELYIKEYVADKEFLSDLLYEIDRLKRDGWIVNSISPVDNLNKGLLFEIASVQPIELA